MYKRNKNKFDFFGPIRINSRSYVFQILENSGDVVLYEKPI